MLATSAVSSCAQVKAASDFFFKASRGEPEVIGFCCFCCFDEFEEEWESGRERKRERERERERETSSAAKEAPSSFLVSFDPAISQEEMPVPSQGGPFLFRPSLQRSGSVTVIEAIPLDSTPKREGPPRAHAATKKRKATCLFEKEQAAMAASRAVFSPSFSPLPALFYAESRIFCPSSLLLGSTLRQQERESEKFALEPPSRERNAWQKRQTGALSRASTKPLAPPLLTTDTKSLFLPLNRKNSPVAAPWRVPARARAGRTRH